MIKQLPKKCTIEIKTEVISVVKGMNVEDVRTLYEKFGFFIEGYQNHPKVQAHMWDGKIRFFSMKGVTYTLLLEEILPIIQKMGYFFTITDDRTGILPKEFKVTSDIFKDCFDKYNNPFVLRDYQCLVSNILLEHGNGILVAATSAGKGSIICALCKGINSTNGFRTIVIVPNRTLVNQSVAECKQYNLEVGEYSGAVKDIDHPIVISTWQTLKNKPEVLQHFSAVIVDECHGSRANLLRDLLVEHAQHITVRFGVTGTMPPNGAQEYTVKSSLGPIRYSITAKWLMDNGYISTLSIRNINIIERLDMNYFPDYASEVTYLCRPQRIVLIAKIINAIHAKDPTKNILCLVNLKSTGNILEQCLDGSFYIDGDISAKKRTSTLNRYATEDGLKGIATFGVASTGVSQDRINILIFVDAGKSFIKVIQSVGRSLRKGGGKNHADVYDIGSNLIFSHDHFKKRIKHYNDANYSHRTTNIDVETVDVTI